MKQNIRYIAPSIIFVLVVAQYFVARMWLENYTLLFGSAILGWSFDFAIEMGKDGFAGFVKSFKLASYYPPAYEAITGIFHYLLGFSNKNILLVNSAFGAMAAFSIYAIGKKISGIYLGFFSAVLFLFFPAIFIFSRVPSKEIALAGAISLCAYSLLCSNRFSSRAMMLLFAFSFSLGMLIKWTFIGYVFFPIIWFFAEAVLKGISENQPGTVLGLEKKQILNVAISAVLIFAVLAPWYLGVLELEYLGRSVGNDPTESTGFFDFFGYYFGTLTDYSGIPLYWGGVLVLFTLSLIGKNRRPQWLIFIWFISGYLLFTLIPHKESRTLFPLIPAICLLMVSGIDTIKKQWFAIAVAVLIVIVSLGQFYYFTYAQPRLPTDAGDLFVFDRPQCKQDTRVIFNQVMEEILAQYNSVNGKSPIRMGTHPFNTNTLYWGADQIDFLLQVRLSKKIKPEIIKMGYGADDYDRFFYELENLQFVLVDEKLFNMSDKTKEAYINAWRDFETMGKSDKTIPVDDFGFLNDIKSNFTLVGSVKALCVEPVRIYGRTSLIVSEE